MRSKDNDSVNSGHGGLIYMENDVECLQTLRTIDGEIAVMNLLPSKNTTFA